MNINYNNVHSLADTRFSKHRGVLLTLLSFLIILNALKAQSQTPSKPNVIFILADDLGYGNIQSFNSSSKIPTPNIDRMAREGMKFTRFYSGSTVCAPSRASLMTGLHMGHAYIRGNGNVSLRQQDTTMAQRLQNNGYTTGMFGKWGLGLENEPGAPQLKGFDEFYGYLLQKHAHHYFTGHLYEVRKRNLQKVTLDTTQYTAELITQRALSFVRENRDNPFFLYFSITLPHAELKVPDSLMKPFRNTYGQSKFQPEKPYNKPNGTTYRSQMQPHAAFAAMVTKLDGDVGRLLKLLKDLGIDDNTYVIFSSDNGPHKEGGGDPEYFNSSGELRGIKRDLYEGGIRVPTIVRAPGKVKPGTVNSQPFAFWDVMPTLGEITQTPTPGNIDGISFLPSLHGKLQKVHHDYLYWQFGERGFKEALIQGEWKLIRFKEKGKPEVLELFNLNKDVGEKSNLAEANTERVRKMKALMVKAKSPPEHSSFDWSDEEK